MVKTDDRYAILICDPSNIGLQMLSIRKSINSTHKEDMEECYRVMKIYNETGIIRFNGEDLRPQWAWMIKYVDTGSAMFKVPGKTPGTWDPMEVVESGSNYMVLMRKGEKKIETKQPASD